MRTLSGSCHCGALGIELVITRPIEELVVGACQCDFCRKHNVRAYADPRARVTLTANDAEHVQRYAFGLRTSESVVCRLCGVYIAMVLTDRDLVWSTVNVDALHDRAKFEQQPVPRDYSAETVDARIARRKTHWIPTTLVGWP